LGKTCSVLILQFCWRENIRDNKKDIVVLPVWDKDSYAERFLVLLTYVYYNPHWFISTNLFTTSQSPSHSGFCQFKITTFAPPQWAHQPHSSFRFPSLSLFLPCTFCPQYVTPPKKD
jgi:hypothetical protein